MIRVTVRDEQSNEPPETMRIKDGPEGYVVICGPGCEVTNEVKYANGTIVLTIKPRASDDVGGADE